MFKNLFKVDARPYVEVIKEIIPIGLHSYTINYTDKKGNRQSKKYFETLDGLKYKASDGNLIPTGFNKMLDFLEHGTLFDYNKKLDIHI